MQHIYIYDYEMSQHKTCKMNISHISPSKGLHVATKKWRQAVPVPSSCADALERVHIWMAWAKSLRWRIWGAAECRVVED